jgi:DNA uptake protein ComE-like DNA-binding protein
MPQTKTIAVNSASQEELERAFQVGREKAEAIVANRPYRD